MDVSKNLCDKELKFFYWNEGVVADVLWKNLFLADLQGSQYLCEIL